MGWERARFGHVAELVDRYERTGDGEGLLGVVLPDEVLPVVLRNRRGRPKALRLLALLRWYRYVQLPGVLGLVERRALLEVLAHLDDATVALPEPLRAFAAAAKVSRGGAPEMLDRGRIDHLVSLLGGGGIHEDWDALEAGSALAVQWLDEARRGYERAALLTDIAEVTYRYGRAGAAGGYMRAEQHAAVAVDATGVDDPHLASRLVLQGQCAELLGDPAARQRALSCYRRAAEAAWRRAPVDLTPLRRLSVALVGEATGSVTALTEAMQVTRDLHRATSPVGPYRDEIEVRLDWLRHKARAAIGENTTRVILDGFRDPLELDALFEVVLDDDTPPEDWRAAASAVTGIVSIGDHRRPVALLALAKAELACCQTAAVNPATCAAPDLAARALDVMPTEHLLRVEAYATLAEALCHAPREHGDESGVDGALDATRRARELLTEEVPLRAGQLDRLAYVLTDIADAASDFTLLPEVVALGRVAVQATPPGDEMRAFRLANLANSLQEFALAEKDQSSLDEAVAVRREAAGALPTNDPRRVGLLFNLAAGLSTTISGAPGLTQLDEAEHTYREGRALLPDDHPDQPRFGSAIALVRYKRYQLTGDRQALADAVELAREAVAATPRDHPWWPLRNGYLARFTDELYRVDGQADVAQRDEALAAYAIAVENPHGPAADRIEAGRRRARLARASGDHAAALQAIEVVMAEIPHLTRRSLTGTVRLGASRQLGALAADAADTAIAAGLPERAVVMVEQCRALVHREALASRRYWVPLRQIDPTAADALERIESRLAEADVYANIRSIGIAATVRSTSGLVERSISKRLNPRPGWAAETRRLSVEREQILRRLAGNPRFDTLLTPPTLAELRGPIAGVPIAMLLSHDDRGHALILNGPPDEPVRYLPLPGMARRAVLAQLNRLETAVADAADSGVPFGRRQAAQNDLHGVLEWLWDQAAGPVLELLDTVVPGQPRLWWCPVGPVTRLPLHAAGYHRDRQPDRTVLDRIVSSYTPTIATLTHALREDPVPAARRDSDVLIVAVPRTPRRPPLPQAEAEARAVRSQVPSARLLLGEAADLATVEAGIRDARIVHFACHGDSDPGLTVAGGSGLHLATGDTLTPAAVHEARPSRGELAFLSACDTAAPHPDLPDEPMHLAAAFQLAGFRSVIGTMWRTPDGPHIARAVYAALTFGGSAPPDTRLAATALTEALRSSRDAYLSAPTRWAAYLHFGA